MYVMQNTPSTATGNIVYTVSVNGVSSSLAVTIAGNVSAGNNTANTVSVNAGDQLSLVVTKAVAVSPTVSQIVVSVELQ